MMQYPESIATIMGSTTRLVIPVVSGINGLATAVRERLRATSHSVLSELFRSGRLEIEELPVPQLLSSTEAKSKTELQWRLDAKQLGILRDAKIVLGDADLCASLLLDDHTFVRDNQLFQHLQWLQSTFAGVEPFERRSDQPQPQQTVPTFQVTRAGGIMGTAMAQYVLGWIVALERKFFEAAEYQTRKEYAPNQLSYRPFENLTVGILGFGDIGQEIGALLKQSGFQVVGLKRSISSTNRNAEPLRRGAHRVTNNLDEVLEQSDFIVNVLPSTKHTFHLLNETLLARCSTKQPVLINVGRGTIIAESALVAALDRHFLSRAVLDVFEKEPVESSSALWLHPKVIMTPHVSAKSFPADVAKVLEENLARYLDGKPLRYQLNWQRGY